MCVPPWESSQKHISRNMVGEQIQKILRHLATARERQNEDASVCFHSCEWEKG